jgi:exonuclease VII small subunit
VKDDAIKCRYCQSALLSGINFVTSPEAKPGAEEKVTYVLDQGLVRFGKFVAGALGIFIVVGTYLFGIKLEVTVEKMRAAQAALEASTKALKAREETAETTSKRLEKAENRAEALLGEIEQNRSASFTLLAEIQVRSLRPSERARLDRIRKTAPEKFRNDPAVSRLWPNGATLRVRFLDGTSEQKETFRKALDEWLRYANLHVEYTESATADVRVSFTQPGSWAVVGTDSIGLVDKDAPTINLGYAEPGSIVPRNYLHEIGHLLGLTHEFKNPNANLRWNKSRIYALLAGPPNYWSKDVVDFNFFAREAYPGSRPFDASSIMMMELNAEFFLDGRSFSMSSSLSGSDEKYIATLYPTR